MAHGKDWLPGTIQGIINMAKKWRTVIGVEGKLYGVSADDLALLMDYTTKAENAHLAALSDKGNTELRKIRDFEIARLAKHMRLIKRKSLFPPHLELTDYYKFDLVPPDTVRTMHLTVQEIVEVLLAIKNIRQVIAHFKIKGASHKAKPVGYEGAVIIWDVLDEPPKDPEKDLKRHEMASRTPHVLHFTEEERGKTVYVAMRWQNERGKVGPLSDVVHTIIP